MHVIGKSGYGKSRLLRHHFVSLFKSGTGVCLIDPHGDLATDVIRQLLQDGAFREEGSMRRIVYLNLPEAASRGLALPLNVLRQPVSPYAVAANVMDALHRYWPALDKGVAPRFDKLVEYGVKVLVSNNLSLPYLPYFLLNPQFRDYLLSHEPDPYIVSQWRDWYKLLERKPQLLVDYVDSTQSRISLLSFHPFLRRSLAARDLRLDFAAMMREGRSVIINLHLESKEERRILGCLLTVLAEQAALQRKSGGKPYVVMLDEFANFIDANPESLNTFLSETRKRNVFGCFAHQDWYQTPPSLQGALGMCGLRVAFRMDYSDAVITSRILGRVDPLTLHQRVEEGSESAGMPEQWQTLVQELEDLPKQYALVRKDQERPWLLPEWTRDFVKWPTSRLYKIKTPTVPDPVVNEQEYQELEEAYLNLYFRNIPDDGAPFQATEQPITPPVPRISRRGSSKASTPVQAGRRLHNP